VRLGAAEALAELKRYTDTNVVRGLERLDTTVRLRVVDWELRAHDLEDAVKALDDRLHSDEDGPTAMINGLASELSQLQIEMMEVRLYVINLYNSHHI
jgi:hypothetical protein